MRIAKPVLFIAMVASLFVGCSTFMGESNQWETLFDGSSVDAWRGYRRQRFPTNSWTIENGALKTIPGAEVVDIVTKDEYENFELELEWRISPGGNSGVLYHVSEDFPEAWNTGPEMQVLDDNLHHDGKNPLTSAGALYALIAPKNKHLKPVGEWNKVRLVVNGDRVEHWLNGKKVVQYELRSEALDELIRKSKFKDKPMFARERTGHVVLQNHHDEVWYRNIRIRQLAD